MAVVFGFTMVIGIFLTPSTAAICSTTGYRHATRAARRAGVLHVSAHMPGHSQRQQDEPQPLSVAEVSAPAARRTGVPHACVQTQDSVRPEQSRPPSSSALTVALQSMHVAAASSAVLAPVGDGPMDHFVARLWDAFESASAITHQPMFEASLAVLAFVVWIAFFESLHLWWPNAASARLDGKPPTRPLHGFGPEIQKTMVPAMAYWGSIYLLFDQLGLGYYLFGAKPVFEAPSYLRVVLEVSSGIFLYDLLFYPFHSSFHQVRNGGWRRLHSRHHQWAAREQTAHNAVETVQNSYIDAGIQVAINILVQNLSPWGIGDKHPLSRVLHNLLVTYLLSEAHSGYDLPFQSHRLFPSIFGGAPRHEEHHQRGNVCFHQFFKYIDDWRGLGPRVTASPADEDAEPLPLSAGGKVSD